MFLYALVYVAIVISKMPRNEFSYKQIQSVKQDYSLHMQ